MELEHRRGVCVHSLVGRLQHGHDRQDLDWGQLRRPIRGFENGIPDEQLAEAAGLSVPRVYQVRDGRR